MLAAGRCFAQQALPRVMVVHRVRELAQGGLLFGGQVTRDLDLEAVEDVSSPATAGLRRPLAAQTLDRAVLRARGHPDPLRPVEGRHLDRPALDRLGDRDRYDHLEAAVAALLEDGGWSHPGDHVEIARRAPAGTVLALAGDPDAAAVANARGHLHPVALALHRQPRPSARFARALDHLAAAAALGARLADREESLALAVHAASPAARADDRGRPRLRAGPLAGRASGRLRHGDRDLDPLHGLLERQRHLGLEVAAAHRLRARSAAAPEEGGEDVAEVGGKPAARAGCASRAALPEAREHAAGVVLLALLGVGEGVVGLLDLLELLLGLLVAGVAVRVVLAGELAVGLLDLIRARLARHAEHRVQIARGHQALTTTRAARRTWPSRR